jgi:arabinose-5-phosphate isomerase
MHPVEAMHGDPGMVRREDLVLALSNSGETDELNIIFPSLKNIGTRTIALTGNLQSTLARFSDLAIYTGVPREACPFGLAPTASTTAMLVLGDALAMTLLQARGFRRQDFAKRHPSGAIGRALLLRVRDIMRSASRNSVASAEMSVKEALLVMTRAKAGSVSVVDRRGRLIGVFTDGDLRRRMAEDDQVLAKPLSRVMTRNPVRVRDDALAVEALKVFNERAIDDLIVVNARHEPVGLVDSQDLPKLKMM